MKRKDLLGKRYGKLLVVAIDYIDNKYGIKWKCLCDCGNTKSYFIKHLTYRQHCGCSKKKSGLASFKSLLGSYKRSALNRKIEWELSYNEFKYFTKQNCFYCGSPPKSIKHPVDCIGAYIYNGLDRLDSSIGYEIDNVVTCCSTCNYAKRDMRVEDFYSWAKSVVDNIDDFPFRIDAYEDKIMLKTIKDGKWVVYDQNAIIQNV